MTWSNFISKVKILNKKPVKHFEMTWSNFISKVKILNKKPVKHFKMV
jgi:hypothetical protein